MTSEMGQAGLAASQRSEVSSRASTVFIFQRRCSMIQEKEHDQVSEDRRKEIFLALVQAQDKEMDVVQSRSFVVQRFNVSESRIRQIEREGMDNQWPPL